MENNYQGLREFDWGGWIGLQQGLGDLASVTDVVCQTRSQFGLGYECSRSSPGGQVSRNLVLLTCKHCFPDGWLWPKYNDGFSGHKLHPGRNIRAQILGYLKMLSGEQRKMSWLGTVVCSKQAKLIWIGISQKPFIEKSFLSIIDRATVSTVRPGTIILLITGELRR